MMATSTAAAAYWDPYDVELTKNPYPSFTRLREEAPLYYNDRYDFYALSRYEDVKSALADKDTFSSARGAILEFIKANAPVPSGVFIFEDPPLHTIHRGLLTRVFTPKRMSALEPLVREYCAKALDPLVGTGKFDFVADLGAQMPMRVIGMLLGIPEEDQQAVRQRADAALRTEPGKPQDFSNHTFVGEGFEEYIDWRAKHPSNDLMTELIVAEFVDEKGITRRLTREEVLIFINVLSSAGNETTNRLIGWTGKTLAENPDQRRQIHENRALIPQAIEEILRYEPPPPHIARYVTRDIEFHGKKVPAGSAMMLLVGAANRDESKFTNAERFDVNRERVPHLTFGHGFHNCLGNALARVEGRVALDEVLNRFPEWDLDLDNARLSPTSTVRGWETLPTFTGGSVGKAAPIRQTTEVTAAQSPVAPEAAATTATSLSGAEVWNLVLATPMGPQSMTAQIVRQGDGFTGTISGEMGVQDISGKIAGDTLTWTLPLTKPVAIKLGFEAKVEGDKMTGKVKLGVFGSATLTGQRG
jgi:cytochrome P450